uniref:Thioredoxin domain-containing protein n=1 Tax=Trypanosoma congolense (strain IL3000) TaxID=1068625 RepID=G0UQK1_TRYCI|nr:conserved hypothetical protein [Trypanosoma congolense IL3000]
MLIAKSPAVPALLALLLHCVGGGLAIYPDIHYEIPSHVVELTDATFDAVVMDPTKDVFVLCCVPWSRRCRTASKLWADVSMSQSKRWTANTFVAATLNAEAFPELAKRMKVNSYPTMLFYTRLEKETPLEYNGQDILTLVDSFIFQNS